MALAFPTPVADFFGKLTIESASPDLPDNVEVEEDGWGSLITVDLGDRLWNMEVTLTGGYYSNIEGQKAKLNVFRQAGRPLLVHALPNAYPQNDPDGAILGASSVTLYSVNANQRDIQLSGLPVGYQLMAGDYLSFQYGTNPVRYAFHQVVTDLVTAGGTTRTPAFEVVPNLRTGYTTGVVVQLIRPHFKGIVVPGSVSPGKSSRQFTSGVSFTVRQTLR